MDNKILVLDIDGTLTTSEKTISEETKRGIQQILQRGHVVCLASGRPSKGMEGCVKELELAKYGGFMLSFNGARITDCKTNEVIYSQNIDKSILKDIYEFALDHDCGLMTYKDDCIITGTHITEYMELESRINQMEIVQVPNFVEYVDFDINKLLMTAPPKQAEKYALELNEKYSDLLSVYRSEPFFVEIMPKNVDKATSLSKLLEKIGLQKEDAICCGDGYNDISMISYAGVGVAMGNAKEEVKKAADYITRTNDEDGLVDVIRKFIL